MLVSMGKKTEYVVGFSLRASMKIQNDIVTVLKNS